jgi:hypothetical protein
MTTTLNAVLKPLLLAILLGFGSGCMQIVKTDMDTYLENKKQFKRKHVVFLTTIEELAERYDLYQGKDIELSAPVSYFGKDDFETWYITLGENTTTIRAYEDNYRDYTDIYAHNLLSWVTSEEGELTVRGKLKQNGIELSLLIYQDYTVETDLKPQRYRQYSRDKPTSIPSQQGYRYGRK